MTINAVSFEEEFIDPFTLFAGITANAQKFALIDMEYILKNIPAYERALMNNWNKPPDNGRVKSKKISEEAKTLYKNYQHPQISLSETQRGKRRRDCR